MESQRDKDMKHAMEIGTISLNPKSKALNP